MPQRSLTAKILIAVGATVAVVIAIYTYFVIRVQSAWWHERTQAQNVIAATMVHEYLNGVMLSERHQEVQNFLMEVRRTQEISRGRVVRVDGQVAFSTETQEVERAVMTLPAELFLDNRVLHGERVDGDERFSVVMRPVQNSDSCRSCHVNDGPHIGAIVLEKSFQPAEAAIAGNRNLLIFYGIVIFVLVGLVLWLLILRLVTQPVGSLLEQMQRVQRGDLRARVATESRDEVGQLASGFNEMVGSLDEAREELRASHDKQIRQAGKLASIGELASGIAHEIRNPLAGIGSAVEILADEDSSHSLNGQRAEIVGEIHRQIKRLNNTLHDLLGFARQREPEIAPCDVRDLVKPMLALVRPDAQKQHVQIVEKLAAELPPICVDEQQIQQVLLNMFLNAIQAMPEGGELTVSAQPSSVACHSERSEESLPFEAEILSPPRRDQDESGGEATVVISVTDTGVGIPAEILPKIFSPFFTTKHRGTGLGLAIVRSIIEKHQGEITVESQVGRGTTFALAFTACTSEELEIHGTNKNFGH